MGFTSSISRVWGFGIVEWLSRLKLDLEAVEEDASDEVLQFEIHISLIYSKFVGLYSPIEQTPVIIQVVSQLLPRVTPEKIHIEVSHCLGLDQDTHLYTLKHLWTIQLPIPVVHLWLASFFNLLP